MAGDDWVWPADNTGLEYYDLSIPWGHGVANWPYFEDVKIERFHYHAEVAGADAADHDGHALAPPTSTRRRTSSRARRSWTRSRSTASSARASWSRSRRRSGRSSRPRTSRTRGPKIQPGDIVIVNTGWHHNYGDNAEYYAYSPGFYKEAGEWFVERGVKGVGTDTPGPRPPARRRRSARTARGGPTGCCRGPARSTRRRPAATCSRTSRSGSRATGRCSRNGIVGFENVGGDIDEVTGKRVTFAAFPWRWMKGDGCIVRLVAMRRPDRRVPHREGDGRRMKVNRFSEVAKYDAAEPLRLHRPPAAGLGRQRRRGLLGRPLPLPARRRHDARGHSDREGLRRRPGRGHGGDRRVRGDAGAVRLVPHPAPARPARS